MIPVKALSALHAKNALQTVNPATGRAIKSYSLHTQPEADAIVEAAHHAFLDWRERSMKQRADIILKIAAGLEAAKESLAAQMAEEMGKPVTQGRAEIERCITICTYTAEEDYKVLLDEERSLKGGDKGIITYQPLGVILGIQPWNFPLYQVIRFSIPALMAGNAAVLKHAKNVWGMAEKIAEIFREAGLPDGLFGVLFVEDEDVARLIAHEKIRAVTLTGSAAAGKSVAAEAGKNLKKTVLELGGSDPYIVLEDADLDSAVKTCVQARISNAGQTCIAAKRFIVPAAIYDTFRDRFVAAMQEVEYGDPMKEETRMGPLARRDLRDTLHRQVRESIAAGAVCLTGGIIPEGAGYFYPASVLENIKPGMPAYDDELFGPVASLFKANDEEDALRIANDHRYGLGGGVMSGDQSRAIALARRIETGMVSVNGYFGSQPNLPFGGVKDSGYGREHGGFGIREFVNIKSIYVGNL